MQVFACIVYYMPVLVRVSSLLAQGRFATILHYCCSVAKSCLTLWDPMDPTYLSEECQISTSIGNKSSFLAVWQRDLCLPDLKIGHSKSLSFHFSSNSFLLYFTKYQSIIYWQFRKLVLHYRWFEKHCLRPQGLNTFWYCPLSLPWPPPAHFLNSCSLIFHLGVAPTRKP